MTIKDTFCFTCNVPLHQERFNRKIVQSFATCFADKRICEDCEREFERKTLPKRAIGRLAAEWKGYSSRVTNAKIKALTTRVQHAKTEFTEDNFTFTPPPIT